MSIKSYYMEKLEKAKDDIGELAKLVTEFQPVLERAFNNSTDSEWDEYVSVQHKMTDLVNVWVVRSNERFGKNQPLFQKVDGWVRTTVRKEKAPFCAGNPYGYRPSFESRVSEPEYINMGEGKIERSGVVDYLHISGSKVQLKDYNSYTGEAVDYEGNKYKLD